MVPEDVKGGTTVPEPKTEPKDGGKTWTEDEFKDHLSKATSTLQKALEAAQKEKEDALNKLDTVSKTVDSVTDEKNKLFLQTITDPAQRQKAEALLLSQKAQRAQEETSKQLEQMARELTAKELYLEYKDVAGVELAEIQKLKSEAEMKLYIYEKRIEAAGAKTDISTQKPPGEGSTGKAAEQATPKSFKDAFFQQEPAHVR